MMTRRIFIAFATFAVAGLGVVALRPHGIGQPLTPIQVVSALVSPEDGATLSSRTEFDVAPVETRVLGQQIWLRGGPASLRVIVTDHRTGKPINANVALTLHSLTNGTPTGQALPLFTGKTNAVGTLDAGFTAPAVAPGPYRLGIAVRTTAYVAWALAESGFAGPQVAQGVAYVKAHEAGTRDPYTLAVILNLLTRTEKDSATTAAIAGRLIEIAKTGDKAAWWRSETETFTGAANAGADIETTGLAAYGLVKWGHNAGFTTKVLTYLVKSKDSNGTWQSTQGTVWALKSLLYASNNSVGGGKGTVTVMANGQPAATFAITPDNSDVMRQIDLKEQLKPGRNDITLNYRGDGSLLYQIVGRYYVPWNLVDAPSSRGPQPLSLSVAYDKTTLAQDDTATVTVTIHNNTQRSAEMPLVDVGVPPGFTVVPDRLDAAVERRIISKYTVAARQVIVYLEKLNPAQTVTLTYTIRAKYPIKARTPQSRAYAYYDPTRVVTSAPQLIVVHR